MSNSNRMANSTRCCRCCTFHNSKANSKYTVFLAHFTLIVGHANADNVACGHAKTRRVSLPSCILGTRSVSLANEQHQHCTRCRFKRLCSGTAFCLVVSNNVWRTAEQLAPWLYLQGAKYAIQAAGILFTGPGFSATPQLISELSQAVEEHENLGCLRRTFRLSG